LVQGARLSSIVGLGFDECAEEKHADENSVMHITRPQPKKYYQILKYISLSWTELIF